MRARRAGLSWRAGAIAAVLSLAASAVPSSVGHAAAASAVDASDCATKKRSKPKAKSKTKKSAKPKPASGDAGGGNAGSVTLESVTPRPRPVPGANPPQEAEGTAPPQVPAPAETSAPASAGSASPVPVGPFVPARMDAANPNRQPDYPMESRALGEQGRVVLWLEILGDGSVGRALIATSSLSPRLDQAAIAAAKTWHYIPATRGGTPVTSGANVFVDFKLSN